MKLYKHPLKYELAMEFVREALEGTNALSIELIKYIRSQQGEFYTLLPDDAHLSKLYIFDSFILQQNPIIPYGDTGKKSGYQMIPTIREALCGLLIDMVKKNSKLSFVIDDFNSTYKDGYDDNFFNFCGAHYSEEVYYLIDSSIMSRDAIFKSLCISNTFWHSVCLLTEASKDDIIDKNLTSSKIQEICFKTKLALFGAYDGEGYIFWEKSVEM